MDEKFLEMRNKLDVARSAQRTIVEKAKKDASVLRKKYAMAFGGILDEIVLPMNTDNFRTGANGSFMQLQGGGDSWTHFQGGGGSFTQLHTGENGFANVVHSIEGSDANIQLVINATPGKIRPGSQQGNKGARPATAPMGLKNSTEKNLDRIIGKINDKNKEKITSVKWTNEKIQGLVQDQ